ncbi:hypothetical protein, partial [Nocardioides sp. R-C-SC26]|uniref:hypothetical protein n=1 Tax=Nocardioides sp. R-C-SC26 TaxID=2870414 RepID=UPI001E2FE72D
MRDSARFDAFYRDARDRLLVQTFALTGDSEAARRAVQQAFVVAAHHWRKLERMDDPETVVRPHAWRLAQRRASTRLFHRERTADPQSAAIVEALGNLPTAQRKALLLTQFAAVTMEQMAREIGLPLEQAERELQHGAAQLSLTLEVPVAGLRAAFDHLGTTTTAPWPRTTIIERSGTRRRRAHSLIGAAGAGAGRRGPGGVRR